MGSNNSRQLSKSKETCATYSSSVNNINDETRDIDQEVCLQLFYE